MTRLTNENPKIREQQRLMDYWLSEFNQSSARGFFNHHILVALQESIATYLQLSNEYKYLPQNLQYEVEGESIAVVWTVDDVLEVATDLSKDEAYRVLLSVKRGHDASIGVSWEVLKAHADFVRDTRKSVRHA